MTERTFLDPLNQSSDLLRDCKDELAMLARALHLTGNSALADKLAANAKDINDAIKLMAEGRDMALDRYVGAVESGSHNMLNATLAAVQRYPRDHL